MTILEYYENNTGKVAKEVKVSAIEDVFSGEDLEIAKRVRQKSEPGSCHYNAGMAMSPFNKEKYEVTFCEGIYAGLFPHCWNKVKNLETGKEYYVDFTLGSSGHYQLLEEWGKDIISLFNARRQAFVPFENGVWMTSKNKRARSILLKHYPAFDR